MKWILFLVFTMSHQNDGRTPIAVDHIVFNTQAACEEMKNKIENKPKSGGLIGTLNSALNGPIIDARCESVNDTAAE